jgi:hypothetical protein
MSLSAVIRDCHNDQREGAILGVSAGIKKKWDAPRLDSVVNLVFYLVK